MKRPPLLPFYHALSHDRQPEWLRHLYAARTVREFEQDLQFLLKNYQPISAEDLVEGRIPTGKPAFHLSFDDGLLSAYELAVPLLEQYGVPATFFLNSAFFNNRDLMYRYKVSLIISRTLFEPKVKTLLRNTFQSANFIPKLLALTSNDEALINRLIGLTGENIQDYLSRERPYMGDEEVRSLLRRGFTIGGHGHNHHDFRLLSEDARIEQVSRSLHLVERYQPNGPRLFAFPFTDDRMSSSFLSRMHEDVGLHASFGTAGWKLDPQPNHFQRLSLETPGRTAASMIRKEYWYRWLGQPLGLHRYKRKAA